MKDEYRAEDLARPYRLGDLVEQLVAQAYQVQAEQESGSPRPQTRIPPLDGALGGSLKPGLHLITGDPGNGKTALGVHTCGGPVPALYVGAEQRAADLFRILIARVTQTPLDDLYVATPERMRDIATQAAAATPNLMLLDATHGPALPDQIADLAARLRDRAGADHVIVCVDSLQCWARGVYRASSEYDAVQAGLKDLVGVASRLSAPILLTSHRNRASAREKQANGLTAAKGSADFEHLAETVIHLSWTKDQVDLRAARELNVVIGKNRHGPAGFSLQLWFHGPLQTFLDERPQGTLPPSPLGF